MRLKIDVTPKWWRTKTEDPETFAEWCVKAVRTILSVWPRAEVRLCREKLFAVVTFDGALRVGQALDEKAKIREMLAAIVEMGNKRLRTQGEMTISDLVLWRSKKIGSVIPEVVTQALTVEGLPYEDIPEHIQSAVFKFRKLKHERRLTLVSKVLGAS